MTKPTPEPTKTDPVAAPKLTALQQNLLNVSKDQGPVVCHSAMVRTARQLEKAGIGLTTSNPGKAYSGKTLAKYSANGIYYVAPNWKWDQATTSFVRTDKVERVVVPPERAKKSKLTVAYEEAKQKHPNMILLFRMGDFYEVFHDDAKLLAKVLGLTLTTRRELGTGAEMPMAGFPHHQLETYLHKLLHGGHRVAVMDEVK